MAYRRSHHVRECRGAIETRTLLCPWMPNVSQVSRIERAHGIAAVRVGGERRPIRPTGGHPVVGLASTSMTPHGVRGRPAPHRDRAVAHGVSRVTEPVEAAPAP